MRKYISFQEKSINQYYRDIKNLYDQYGDRFKRVSDLVEFIAKKLDISPMAVSQMLPGVGTRKPNALALG